MGRRKQRLARPLLHIHNCEPALEIERAAYFGGRCDVFQIGRIDNDAFVLDVNSLYPAMMQKHKYPVRLLAVEQSPSISQVERWCENEAVCCTVEIRSQRHTYPYRDAKGSRQVLGSFITGLATPEVRRAIANGQLHRVFVACRYSRADLFSQYVDRLHGMRIHAERERGENAGLPYKLLLNSLYGKFAQRRESWLSVDTVRPIDQWAEWSSWDREKKEACHYRAMAGKVEQCIQEGEWIHSFPAVAAHVTAYGREYQRELIQIAGVENVYYTDTDSLHCNSAGRDRIQQWGLLHPTAIGMLRIESEATECEYRGRRYYRVGSDCVVAGATFQPRDWITGQCEVETIRGAKRVLRYGPSETVEHLTKAIQYHDRHIRGTVLPNSRVLPEVIGDEQIEVAESAL